MFRLLSVPNCSATRERRDKGAQTERYLLSVYIKGHRDVLNNEEGLIVSWSSDTLLSVDRGKLGLEVQKEDAQRMKLTVQPRLSSYMF